MDSGRAHSTCVEAADAVARMRGQAIRVNADGMARVQVIHANADGEASGQTGLSLAAGGERVVVVLTDGTGAAIAGLAVRRAECGDAVVVHELGVAMFERHCWRYWPSSRCMAMN